MAMVIYEARSYKPISPGPGSNLMLILQVLAGVKPYHNRSDTNVPSKAKVEEIPTRFPGSIGDTVWSLLEGCWSKVPAERPPLVKLYTALSEPGTHNRVTGTLEGPVIVGIPPKLCFYPVAINFLSGVDLPTQCQLYLRLEDGQSIHTTPAKKVRSRVEYVYA